MAADYVKINRALQLGNNLVRAADLLLEVRQLVSKMLAAGNHSNDGTNYTLMESNFGLPAGSGANVLFLLGLVDTILNSASTVTGTNRLAQLDEFCARLAGQ